MRKAIVGKKSFKLLWLKCVFFTKMPKTPFYKIRVFADLRKIRVYGLDIFLDKFLEGDEIFILKDEAWKIDVNYNKSM